MGDVRYVDSGGIGELIESFTAARIDDLMDLYPQAGEGRPAVMYVPLRRPTSGPQARQNARSGREK